MSSLTFFFVFAAILAILFLAVNFVFAPHNSYREKNSNFECGFHSYLQNRMEFVVSHYVFAFLHLILDLDIVLLFPFSQSQDQNEPYGLIFVLLFIFILTAGFVFEIGKGALKIESRQIHTQLRTEEARGVESSKSFFSSTSTSTSNKKELVLNTKNPAFLSGAPHPPTLSDHKIQGMVMKGVLQSVFSLVSINVQ